MRKFKEYVDEFPKLKELWEQIPEPIKTLFEVQIEMYVLQELGKEKRKKDSFKLKKCNESEMSDWKSDGKERPLRNHLKTDIRNNPKADYPPNCFM